MGYRTSRRVIEKEERIHAWANRPSGALATGDVVALERAIHGQVVVPGDADYDLASQQANPAFVRKPRLVVYCETPGDVRQSLAFARRLDLAVRCRSGGHSTAGYSVADGCMVIDTSRMRYVHVSDEAEVPIAHVGAGSDWGYVNAVLDSFGLHVPGGGCESVCVAGFMQGGGYGYTSRMYGMNCDNVVAVKVMLADGRILVADERRNVPLFWAVRGGTGGNFGVLLEISYRLHRTRPLWDFGLRWRIEDAPRAILAIQDGYMRTNPSRLIGCETHGTTVDGRQMLLMRGIYRGGRADALEALGPALATPGAELEYAALWSRRTKRFGRVAEMVAHTYRLTLAGARVGVCQTQEQWSDESRSAGPASFSWWLSTHLSASSLSNLRRSAASTITPARRSSR